MTLQRRPRVAVDAMGGDHAPESVVLGAIEAVEHFGSEFDVYLVGDEVVIREHLPSGRARELGIEIVHATESIGMGESAAQAYRKKPDSSIAVGLRMQAEGAVDALVSAGNTGAVVAASLFELKRIKGVQRPAIASLVPTGSGHCLLLDVGATSDTKPLQLYQFGVMGRIYTRCVYDVQNPKVGLLNIGEESSKGSELAQDAYKILSEGSPTLNFVGNVEGRDILTGKVDVVICDGFTGNVILKFAESVVGMVVGTIREDLRKSLRFKLGALLLKPVFSKVKSRLNYEEYGGAPLLGVNGTVVIAHGSSSPKAIRNAIRVAATSAHQGVDVKIGEELARELQHEAAG